MHGLARVEQQIQDLSGLEEIRQDLSELKETRYRISLEWSRPDTELV